MATATVGRERSASLVSLVDYFQDIATTQQVAPPQEVSKEKNSSSATKPEVDTTSRPPTRRNALPDIFQDVELPEQSVQS